MIRLIVRTQDSSFACNIGGPGTSADISFRTFDISVPELEAFLQEPKAGKWNCVERSIIGAEVVDVALIADHHHTQETKT